MGNKTSSNNSSASSAHTAVQIYMPSGLEKRQAFLTGKIEQCKLPSEQTQLEQHLDEVNAQLLALQQQQLSKEMQQIDDHIDMVSIDIDATTAAQNDLEAELKEIQDSITGAVEEEKKKHGDRLVTLEEVNRRLIQYKRAVEREESEPGFIADGNKRYTLYRAQMKRLLQYRIQMKKDSNVKVWLSDIPPAPSKPLWFPP